MRSSLMQKGYSLLEVLLVIVIFGVLAGGAISSGTSRFSRRNSALAVISRVKSDILEKRANALLGQPTANRTFEAAAFAFPPGGRFVSANDALPFPGAVNPLRIEFQLNSGRAVSGEDAWYVIDGPDGSQYAAYVPFVRGFSPIYQRLPNEAWTLAAVNH